MFLRKTLENFVPMSINFTKDNFYKHLVCSKVLGDLIKDSMSNLTCTYPKINFQLHKLNNDSVHFISQFFLENRVKLSNKKQIIKGSTNSPKIILNKNQKINSSIFLNPSINFLNFYFKLHF